MKAADFKDVSIFDKASSTTYFAYEVAFNDQKSIEPEFGTDLTRVVQHSLDHHYCISFIDCPFIFNFESLVSHFEWCFKFIYFNFSETTLQFDVLKRLKEQEWNVAEISTLINIYESNKKAYTYTLDEYTGKIKFALLKHSNAQEKETLFPQILERDEQNRLAIINCLKSILVSKNGRIDKQPDNINDHLPAGTKYEASQYGYLRITDVLSDENQQTVISFLYDNLKELFITPYSLIEFSEVFRKESSGMIEINISLDNTASLDTQKLHLILRRLKDEKIIIASWEVIKQKIGVYNKAGEWVNSVYQISKGKISTDKLRQVNKLLKPLFDLLP
jgi:hypothetical protein